MGGDIPGGNFLGGNFQGGDFPGGVWWGEIFQGEIFLELLIRPHLDYSEVTVQNPKTSFWKVTFSTNRVVCLEFFRTVTSETTKATVQFS